MSSSSPQTNLIGPINFSHWYTMRELREGVRDFQKENRNGCYDYNIEVHNRALKDMIQEVVR